MRQVGHLPRTFFFILVLLHLNVCVMVIIIVILYLCLQLGLLLLSLQVNKYLLNGSELLYIYIYIDELYWWMYTQMYVYSRTSACTKACNSCTSVNIKRNYQSEQQTASCWNFLLIIGWYTATIDASVWLFEIQKLKWVLCSVSWHTYS